MQDFLAQNGYSPQTGIQIHNTMIPLTGSMRGTANQPAGMIWAKSSNTIWPTRLGNTVPLTPVPTLWPAGAVDSLGYTNNAQNQNHITCILVAILILVALERIFIG
ncbi:MAG: hypothetical protein FWG40_09540 [Peptococcaceae bacterium]|nr:hypothetical protein [Peptococcaceae bacterium]